MISVKQAKLRARLCKKVVISTLIICSSCYAGLTAETSEDDPVRNPADLFRAFRLESGSFPPPAEKVAAASAVYSVFKGDSAGAVQTIDAEDAGAYLWTYGDWFFCQKQFDRASFYYELTRLTRWRSDVDSRDNACRKKAKYRLELMEENRDDCRGRPLEMYAQAAALWGTGFREKMNRIKVLYPQSRIIDDVDFALSKGMDDDLELASHWQQFLHDHPQSPLCSEVQKWLTMTYGNLGAKARNEGRYEEAERWYATFLERPVVQGEYKYHGSYIGAGHFFEKRGKPDIAEKAYRKAVECDGWPSAYNALGFFYERHYDLEKYIEYLQERGKSEWEIERHLSDMGVEKWCRSFGAFPKKYDLCGADEFEVNGDHFFGQLYKRKTEEDVDRELPQYVLRVSGDGDKLLLRIDSALFEAGFKSGSWYKIVRAGAMVLCVPYPSGGNGLNVNPYYVASLEKEAFLKVLGRVGYIEDFDGDGEDDLIWYEDVWESGLRWFGHAGGKELSPKIYYHVVEGKLLPYEQKNIRSWRDEIRKFDEQIETYCGDIPKNAALVMEPEGSWLLHTILSKFLRYRLLGETRKGVQELSRDLRYYDEEYFYFQRWAKGDRGMIVGKYPASDIEQTVKTSLEHSPVPTTCKKSLWAYVNPP